MQVVSRSQISTPLKGGCSILAVFTIKLGKKCHFWVERAHQERLEPYIYIYMVWCHYLVQVWAFEGSLSGPSLFLLTRLVGKNTIKIGFQHIFQKELRAKNEGHYLVQVCLDQIMTPQNDVFCCVFLLLKMCQNIYFYSVFDKQQKLAKKTCPKKSITFTFCKTQVDKKKKTLCRNPPLDPKLVFFELAFLKKNIDVEQKTKLKSKKKQR